MRIDEFQTTSPASPSANTDAMDSLATLVVCLYSMVGPVHILAYGRTHVLIRHWCSTCMSLSLRRRLSSMSVFYGWSGTRTSLRTYVRPRHWCAHPRECMSLSLRRHLALRSAAAATECEAHFARQSIYNVIGARLSTTFAAATGRATEWKHSVPAPTKWKQQQHSVGGCWPPSST